MVLTEASSKYLRALVNTLESLPLAPPSPKPPAAKRIFRLTESQRQAVGEAYKAGATMAGLGRQYGVKRQTIGTLLHQEGVTSRVRASMSEAEKDEAARLYA